METYLVGGAVRDELLGLPVKDRDWVVVGATPEDMLARGFKQVGADFPVFLHPKTREEYALARTERKQGRGYHGFEVYSAPDVTLEDDLRRRDLTINAMAKSDTGELVDPFHGRDHLAARQLHHVSSAFAEDPLRILRTARFAARFAPQGFTVAGETMALMRDMVRSGEVGHLVPERVWQEIQRALMEQSPTTFFDVLQACGALTVLIPELEEPSILAGAMTALQCCQAHDWPLEVRFAALLSAVGAAAAIDRAAALKAPNDCKDLARLCVTLGPAIARVTGNGDSETSDQCAEAVLDILEQADVWRRPERFERLLQACRCTLADTRPAGFDILEQAVAAARAVNPRELMAQGHKGKALGEAIRNERLRRIADILTAH
ncbi:multifunctional CCA tRNA nucleotidyl transferase/2'3'-cyclic phosphodiesterase/2'nucleotidase/phosphatase [Marinobacter profundi]|uniref:CCA-adding enzyme n=1 Tax=Marinobacter profundi TaxID=2666256 RepID=A0A2G1UMQ4_9GAMM|nr:multifunctional CCA tRNA nucleotidyl transferase/2'3'-cyclic phosphodiesterase/2'nucleotidase/phosphatase [Marinobacter profundi]PHQ15752.1 multifunctional CCA tRNA nucleotidyl transferase/2'3'-cyclic phosphodiesterase/2'nucleotidase/phosphatase [Marinobacter profundi]